MAKKIENKEVVLEWTEPPVKRRGSAVSERHQQIAAALRERPGEWAKVADGAANDGLAVQIRRGTAVSFRDGVFEARSRSKDDGTIDVYARFVGDKTE